ncbi:MAG: nickel-dependent hydrogenase large subunit [Clostridia bacterium]|nr:nickel-dependent hydrogenase large subunit [Clostridia bacterium]
MARITVDPITRIEGHLRIDVEVANGKVSDAWSSAQAFRGIETIMRGKDPRSAWAMVQRFCGVCTTTHALCSIRAVEDAYNVEVPVNAQMMRNLVMSMQSLQDHIVHFYHLTALDWVDIVSALKADPAKAGMIAQSLSNWPSNSYNEMKDAQDKLKAFVGTGNLGIYGSGYWGHPDMRLTPEVNLIGFAHYLQALEYQRKIAQAVAIIGSKNPHIQNLCVGGVSTAIDMDSIAALNMERVAWIRNLLDEVAFFVREVYIPDVIAIASAYKDWFDIGSCESNNYIATPDFPMDPKAENFLMPGGIIVDGKFRAVTSWKDEELRNDITETSIHSWYKEDKPLHPYDGAQTPNYTGFEDKGKYSWCKAPRLAGKVMQTGPISQVLAGYYAGSENVKKYVDLVASKVGIKVSQLNSTMGRNAARAIRSLVMVDNSYKCLETFLDNYAKGDHEYVNNVPTPKGECQGAGFNEAPRGMLSHWVKIKDGVIENYSAVVPSTWDASPRDENGVQGPYEQSLMNTKIAEPEKPLEVLRSIHSFDPCIACAVHTVDPEGKEIVQVKVR